MFCAICTDECDGSRKAPLGRDGVAVVVCSDCDEAPAVEKYGPERGYEPTGGLPNYADGQRGIERAMGADYQRLTRLENALSMTPMPSDFGKTDADFATLHFDQETRRRRRAGSLRIQRRRT